jgi:pimeloyl-ACP methyl ester carboxylesterase
MDRGGEPPILLVHGAWFGAWCWERVVPHLEAAGRRVVTIDLPSHGADTTPPAEVTLDLYAARVCETLAEFDESAVVLGHSMGGVVISQAAERCPHRFARLLYLAAFLIQDGETLLDIVQNDPNDIVHPHIVFNDDHTTAALPPEALRDAFYTDCSDEDVAWLLQHVRPEATAPFGAPLQVTSERWGSIPRTYLYCTDDQALSMAMQDQMVARVGVDDVARLAASHSPFVSVPKQLADVIAAAR